MTTRRFRHLPLWLGAATFLVIPAIAMQFSNEISWGVEDFAVLGALLLAFCGTIELAARTSMNRLFVSGVALAAAGGFLLVFINLAVGVIGDEGNPRNLVFFAIPILGFLGALISRFRPSILIQLLFAMAAIQVVAAFLAPVEMMRLMIPFTAVFVGIWLISALLIRRSIRP